MNNNPFIKTVETKEPNINAVGTFGKEHALLCVGTNTLSWCSDAYPYTLNIGTVGRPENHCVSAETMIEIGQALVELGTLLRTKEGK